MNHGLLALAISLVCTVTYADESTNIIRLKTVTAAGNSLFNITPTEETHAYTAQAATVGTKTPANLRDIPQSVSIVTQQSMNDRNVQILDDLAKQTAGLRVLANDSGRSSIYARGYEYDEYSVNGLPAQMQSIYGNLPNLAAFDRVEIMRGPNGLFNSTTEMGGVVNLVRKRPTAELKGSVTAGVSYPMGYNLAGDIGGGFNADGSVKGRIIAASSGKRNTHAKYTNHTETLYTALDWDISGSTTLGVGYLYQQRHIKPDNGLPLAAGSRLMKLPVKDYYGTNWSRFNNQSHDLFADFKHQFADGGTFQAGARYSHRDIKFNYAFPGSALSAAGTMRAATGTARKVKQDDFTIDANYSRPFDTLRGTSEFVVGADFKTLNRDIENARASFRTNLTLQQLQNYPDTDILGKAKQTGKGYTHTDEDLREAGVYGKITFRPIQSLALIGGGRISHWKIGSENHLNNTSISRSGNGFTGYAGIVYDINDNHSVYASYSALNKPQTDTDSTGQFIGPRKGHQYEIGLKSSYFGDRLNSRVSLFQLTDNNTAGTTADGDTAAIGKRRVRGVELEAAGEVLPNWNISAGYSYLDTKIVRTGITRNDAIFLLMPKNTLNIWSTYAITPEWTVGGGVNAMSSFESNTRLSTAGGYATADLMARYQPTPNFSTQLNINNIFNRHYYTRVGGANTFNIPGEERNASLTFKYQF